MVIKQKNEKLNIAIFGANSGIAKAMIELHNARDNVEHIYAYCRHPDSKVNTEKVSYHQVDYVNEDSVTQAARNLPKDTTFAHIFIFLGLLHNENTAPEKSLRNITLENMQNSFSVNTFAPMLIIKHFSKFIPRKSPATIACLSARVGSISDNQSGGWYSYRASKAALNMMIKCTAIEKARMHPQLKIFALHPGTVDTPLSEPFQKNVKTLFTPEQCANYLWKVIEQADNYDSGSIIAWDGKVIQP